MGIETGTGTPNPVESETSSYCLINTMALAKDGVPGADEAVEAAISHENAAGVELKCGHCALIIVTDGAGKPYNTRGCPLVEAGTVAKHPDLL